jgi:outer membrane murein-binding lipoprotein Lpp
MRIGLPLLALGISLMSGAVAAHRYQRDRLATEHATVVELRRRVAVARHSLRSAITAADSTAAQAQITDRTYWLGRREYHVPPLEARVANWWALTGTGTLLLGVGTLFTLAGTVLIFRR